MATSTITGTILDGTGAAVSGCTVTARLRPGPGSRLTDGSSISNPATTTTNGSGVYTFALERQTNIVPPGSWWEITEARTAAQGGPRVITISVPAASATVQQCEVTPLALLGPSALTQAQGDARYIYQGDFWINVQNDTYGAVGDGTTDDTAAIQAALAAAADGVVYFPPGTYLISSPLAPLSGTIVQGAGVDVTTITLKAGSFASFDHAYLIQGTGSAVQVRDLTVDTNRRAGGYAANQGGGIAPHDHWIVERVKFYDCNYFKCFINGKINVRLRDCRFHGNSGNDNLGGGSTNRGVIVENCYWASDVAALGTGNAIDFTNGLGYQIRGCHFEGGDIYLEGVTDSTVAGCFVDNSNGIAVQDDSGYSPATVTHSRNVRIVDNEIVACTFGVRLRYFLLGGGGTAIVAGGGNVVEGNIIRRSTKMAILVHGYDDTYKTVGDVIVGNVIDQTNFDSSATYNSGGGVFDNAGIALGCCNGDIVTNNRIDDTQAVPTMTYGISLGGTSAATNVKNTTLIANNVSRNHTAAVLRLKNSAKVATDTILRGNPGYNPVGNITAPAVPSTTVAYTNALRVDCTVFVTAGAGSTTAVAVGGVAAVTIPASGIGTVRVPSGQSITLTYTSAPTWTWFGD